MSNIFGTDTDSDSDDDSFDLDSLMRSILLDESSEFYSLHSCSRNGHLERLNQLLAEGADVNNPKNFALHIAGGYGHLEIVNVLLVAGAKVTKEFCGYTPLHIASSNGRLQIIKRLIAYGADYDHRHPDGTTPLDVARNDETKAFILKEIRWSRRRPLLLTRPHIDHETNKKHKLKPLGDIITATKGDDSSNQNDVLFQIKIKIASFL